MQNHTHFDKWDQTLYVLLQLHFKKFAMSYGSCRSAYKLDLKLLNSIYNMEVSNLVNPQSPSIWIIACIYLLLKQCSMEVPVHAFSFSFCLFLFMNCLGIYSISCTRNLKKVKWTQVFKTKFFLAALYWGIIDIQITAYIWYL